MRFPHSRGFSFFLFFLFTFSSKEAFVLRCPALVWELPKAGQGSSEQEDLGYGSESRGRLPPRPELSL